MSFPESPGWKGEAETGRDGACYYAPQGKGRRAQVLDGLGDGCSTAEEIAERIDLHWYLVRPRLSELKAMGLVTDSGGRGTGALGGKVISWRKTTIAEREAFAEAQEVDHG